ncbi:unnamed protein product [Cyclocybe aegerita]|uniref:FMR1-interacting protein 1 conserved domain-containing protein n=1 Tax=Cyclocybe aegerita TaxID=1973307 RepID=A0A8S0WNA6_CYCAE|nr:unnamed protein product [Cyclocybe aegerita]
MQRSSLPPPPPSLPQNSNSSASGSNSMYQYQQPSASYAYPTYHSPHYAQAYYQPAMVQSAGQYNNSFAPTGTSTSRTFGASTRGLNVSTQSMSSWYQGGTHRCSHPGCSFMGSHKSVETHMMDRHLIFPVGWEKRKMKDDWDADPSLKGKTIPIQGTNVVLDTPEVIDAWIEERKKRFPTAAYVEDKKRKREEAIARGQLDMIDTGGRQNKRQKIDNNHNHNPRNAAHGNNGRNAFQGRRHGQFSGDHGTQGSGARSRVPDAGWPRNGKTEAKESAPETSKRVPSPSPSCPSDSDRDDDCGDEPEIFSSKASLPPIPSQIKEEPSKSDGGSEPLPPQLQMNKDLVRPKKTLPLQPRQAPHNQFASRPSLLRNLLLPEIRATISNLSQAIRFLVDNDFLREVELKPGQAVEENKIQVLPQDQLSSDERTLE